MQKKLFGMPLVLWGVVCLLLAGVWLVVWPSDRAGAALGMRLLVLRWFHARVWLLLAFTAWSTANRPRIAATTRIGALAAYGIFLFAVVTS